jgi:hypothetical protein
MTRTVCIEISLFDIPCFFGGQSKTISGFCTRQKVAHLRRNVSSITQVKTVAHFAWNHWLTLHGTAGSICVESGGSICGESVAHFSVEYPKGQDTLFELPKLRVINKQYLKLANKAEIEKFTSYDLRHTFAVDFMDNEENTLEDLAVILGHVKIETTRIYGKISAERQKRKMFHLEQHSLMHQLS